jgi:molecular chaperone GrpE
LIVREVGSRSQDERARDDASDRPAAPDGEPTRVAQLQERLEAKDRELRELTATYRRDVNEEVEVVKERLARDAENQRQIDRVRLVDQLLPVLDNLALARSAATRQQADGALLDGIALVEQQFLEKLEGLGVKRFDSVGARFDPKLHQAAGTVPAPDSAAEGVVLTELHPGYCLGDRLIRPAMVLVGYRPSPDGAPVSRPPTAVTEGRPDSDHAVPRSRPIGEGAWSHREGSRRR